MISASRDEYKALLRRDFPSFCHWSFRYLSPGKAYLDSEHISLVQSRLVDWLEGRTKRLIINQPPRSLKSHMASVALPAYVLGLCPWKQIVCASYSQGLSDKFGLDTLRLLQADLYREIFDAVLSPDKQAVADFETTMGGYRLATSVGGTLLGRGGDLIIIDDALNADEAASDLQRQAGNDWYDKVALGRVNDPNRSGILIVSQRLHEDDLVGHVLGQEKWEHLRLPAIAEEDEAYSYNTPCGPRTYRRKAREPLHPARASLQVLEQRRANVGPYVWAAQDQQRPAPADGGLVKPDWFLPYEPHELPKFRMKVQSWDTASTVKTANSFCVCVTLGVAGTGAGLRIYILDVLRRRMLYPDLESAFYEQQGLHDPTHILIEEKSAGPALLQNLARAKVRNVIPINPTLDKRQRLYNQLGLLARGCVFIPKQAVWLPDFIPELVTFPNATFDDQVDATSQGLEWIADQDAKPKASIKCYSGEPTTAGELHGGYYDAALRSLEEQIARDKRKK